MWKIEHFKMCQIKNDPKVGYFGLEYVTCNLLCCPSKWCHGCTGFFLSLIINQLGTPGTEVFQGRIPIINDINIIMFLFILAFIVLDCNNSILFVIDLEYFLY